MAKLLDQLDELHNHTRYAKTLGIMLHDLLCADDEIPVADINDPASREQRMFIVLETLQEKVDAIGLVGDAIRKDNYRDGVTR